VNMTEQRRQVLWEIVNDQMEGIEKADAEWVCEQWVAEVAMGMRRKKDRRIYR
jgi:hypothetical protein